MGFIYKDKHDALSYAHYRLSSGDLGDWLVLPEYLALASKGQEVRRVNDCDRLELPESSLFDG